MGITVHYGLKFVGTAEEAKKKLVTLKRLLNELPLKENGKLYEMDFSKNHDDDAENYRVAGEGGKEEVEGYRWLKIQYTPRGTWTETSLIPEPDVAKFRGWAFRAWAGNGCEPTNLGLISKDGRNWTGGAFTKTQYAEEFVKAHVLVCTIMDVCKKLGILDHVSDEADYWDTRDLSVLAENINKSTAFIMQVAGMIKGMDFDEVHSAVDGCKNFVKVVKTPRPDKVVRLLKRRGGA